MVYNGSSVCVYNQFVIPNNVTGLQIFAFFPHNRIKHRFLCGFCTYKLF